MSDKIKITCPKCGECYFIDRENVVLPHGHDCEKGAKRNRYMRNG